MPAPQIRLTAPTPDDVRAWLIAQPDTPPPYPAAGATRDAPTDGRPPPGVPASWNVDHRRVHLGDGEAVYAAAQAALMTFAPLDIGWVWPVTTTPRPEPTTRGAMIVRAFGLVWVNAWRVVYVDDDVATAHGGRRTAFAYGTLEAHAERGEERFMVEMLPDGSVWYDILAFSHPHHVLARLGGPVTRWLQRRFGPASVGRMRETVMSVMEHSKGRVTVAGSATSMIDGRKSKWPMGAYDAGRVVTVLCVLAMMIVLLVALGLISGDSSGSLMVELMLTGGFLLALLGALPLAAPYLLERDDHRPRMASAVMRLPMACLFAYSFSRLANQRDASPDWSGALQLVTVGAVAWFTWHAVQPLLGPNRAATRPLHDLVLRAAFILWLIGAIWITIDAFNYAPLGFPQTIVRLTAVHFHFAGFIIPVIAATLARAYPSRLANAAAVVALLGVPSTAIGITATQLGAPHVVEALLALPMIAGALLVAAVHLGLAFGPHGLAAPMRVVALRAVVGLTLIATMTLALVYALRGWLPWSPTIPQMALWHGIGNAFGVATCGLIACWLDPATQPPVG